MIFAQADDTIAAVSSAGGPSPRGVVRLSGPRATHIANELFTRYSVFDSDTDIDGDAISELGFGWRHTLGLGATFTLSHEIFRDALVSNSPYGVTTARLQFKF